MRDFIKVFIREQKMENQESKRTFYGKLAGIVGIIVNILLALGKILVGVLFGAISVTADGLNNLTDCGSSIISTVSFRLSSKPADKEHPYGHERIEYVLSMVVAFIIFFVAFETLSESINKIIEPQEFAFSFIVPIVLGVSVIAKFGLFFYYRITAKKINSSILKASAIDSLSDCISTSVVIICYFVSLFTGYNIDGYAGILVSLFIGYAAVGVLKEVFSHLIGRAPDEELLKEIKDKVLSFEGVLGVHDLMVYSYGPNKYFASVHIEVDAKVDVLQSHELVDLVEKEFYQETGIIITGHLDPIVIDDERVNEIKAKVQAIISDIDNQLSMHDFRVVFGENRTNLLFDVVVPFEYKMKKEELIDILNQKIKEIDERYCLVVTIENNL